MIATTETLDLTTLDRDALAEALRTLPVERWNEAYTRARRNSGCTWRASLDGAYLAGAYLAGAILDGAYLAGAILDGAILVDARLDGAILDGASLARASLVRASLARANLDGAYLVGANLARVNLADSSLVRASLARANLDGAYLVGARLADASLDGYVLTGRHAWIGEAAGYPVLLLATDSGHVLRAGCWTGVLDDALDRAIEELDTPLVRAEAEAVVSHGHAILNAWHQEATDE